jgi:2-(1,2-epoxy-1,2-dihydrophenyl)acetyl-CoA isomerase
MSTDHLLIERRDGVLYLTMNRPDKLNALSDTMNTAMVAELTNAATDKSVGCVVLTGAGRGFCSGGDIGGMRERNEAVGESRGGEPATIEDAVARLRRGMEVSALLHEIPKVTIAAVNGAAAGAGLSIALAADIRLASEGARFATAFARVGFGGDYGGTYFLTQLVGTAKARELYFTADIINAEEALRLGIANRVFPAASFKDEVHTFAKKIAAGPQIAYQYMKANLNQALRADMRTLLDREAWGQNLTGRTQDHREAVKAFLEKREPKFIGR